MTFISTFVATSTVEGFRSKTIKRIEIFRKTIYKIYVYFLGISLRSIPIPSAFLTGHPIILIIPKWVLAIETCSNVHVNVCIVGRQGTGVSDLMGYKKKKKKIGKFDSRSSRIGRVLSIFTCWIPRNGTEILMAGKTPWRIPRLRKLSRICLQNDVELECTFGSSIISRQRRYATESISVFKLSTKRTRFSLNLLNS